MYWLLRPLLFCLDAEQAHRLTLRLCRALQDLDDAGVPTLRALAWAFAPTPSPRLTQELMGLRFPSPFGLAAGVDKDAELVPLWRALGFGAVEIGSVSAHPTTGNPRPRAFRLTVDHSLLNRMGLPSIGAAEVARRLRRIPRGGAPLGVNLAKTHDTRILGDAAVEDFAASYATLSPLCDYVVLNVSCPNSADGRTFEEPEALGRLLQALAPLRAGPLLLKLSPPPAEALAAGMSPRLRGDHVYTHRLRELLAVARAHRLDGLVLGNSAPVASFPPGSLRSDPDQLAALGPGGVSGPPLRHRAVALLRTVYSTTRAAGYEPVLIGLGGVDSAQAAYERVRAGASLLQLYTALVYEGPGLLATLQRGLLRCLARDRLPSLAAAVGMDA